MNLEEVKKYDDADDADSGDDLDSSDSDDDSDDDEEALEKELEKIRKEREEARKKKVLTKKWVLLYDIELLWHGRCRECTSCVLVCFWRVFSPVLASSENCSYSRRFEFA